MSTPHSAIGIDQIFCRPVLIIIIVPRCIIIILCDWVMDIVLLDGVFNIVRLMLKRKFRCVDSDDYKPLVMIFVIPTRDMRKRADAIYTCVRPEIDENDFAFQLLD